MKLFFIVLGIVFFLIILGIFGFWGYSLHMEKTTSSLIDDFVGDYYKHYNSGDYSYIYNTMVSGEYQYAVSFDKFKSVLEKAFEVVGPIKARKMTSWKLWFAPGGIYFLVSFADKGEKENMMEKFVLKRDGNAFRIVNNNIIMGATMKDI